MEKINKQILDAFNYRHACKLFDETKKISEKDFNTILESARLSPTSFGFEPFQLLIIQDVQAREYLREHSWGANGQRNNTAGQLGTASHFILILTHKAHNMRAGSDYLQGFMRNVKKLPDDVIELYGGFFSRFQKNDFNLNSEREINDWAAKQAYIVLANMMSAAAFLGIDSCPIEGFDRTKINQITATEFGVDTNQYEVGVMLALGYRKNEPEFSKTRRKLDDMVQWI